MTRARAQAPPPGARLRDRVVVREIDVQRGLHEARDVHDLGRNGRDARVRGGRASRARERGGTRGLAQL